MDSQTVTTLSPISLVLALRSVVSVPLPDFGRAFPTLLFRLAGVEVLVAMAFLVSNRSLG